MEKRNVSITLEKAKEWYNQGGNLKEIALQAYKEEEELIGWPTNINDPRLDLPISPSRVPLKIRYQWKLYKLLAILNPKGFDPGYSNFYVPRIWWHKKKEDIYNNVTFVGEAKTLNDEILYISIGGNSTTGLQAVEGLFVGHSQDVFSHILSVGGIISQLKCATPEIRQHLEKYFWKEIIKAHYFETVTNIKEI